MTFGYLHSPRILSITNTRQPQQDAYIPTMVSRRRPGTTKLESGAALPTTTSNSTSTQWRRANGRPTKRDKPINQQYLNPQEEKVLTQEALRMTRDGYPWRVKHLPILAQLIARHAHFRDISCRFRHPLTPFLTPLAPRRPRDREPLLLGKCSRMPRNLLPSPSLPHPTLFFHQLCRPKISRAQKWPPTTYALGLPNIATCAVSLHGLL
jgi:hypothetical protein